MFGRCSGGWGFQPGGLTGYLSFEFKAVLSAIKEAYRKTISFKINYEWLKAYFLAWSGFSSIFLNVTVILFPLALIDPVHLGKTYLMKVFITELITVCVIIFVCGVVALIFAEDVRRDGKKAIELFKCNPFSIWIIYTVIYI